jgi:hypothetical protein
MKQRAAAASGFWCLNGIWLNFNWPPRRARAHSVKMIIVVVVAAAAAAVVPLALAIMHTSHIRQPWPQPLAAACIFSPLTRSS